MSDGFKIIDTAVNECFDVRQSRHNALLFADGQRELSSDEAFNEAAVQWKVERRELVGVVNFSAEMLRAAVLSRAVARGFARDMGDEAG